jgi:hypothetical protein
LPLWPVGFTGPVTLIVAIADQFLRDADSGRYGNADRRTGNDFLAGRKSFVFVLVLVPFHVDLLFAVSSRVLR